jgi:hypothetical protein
MPQKRSRLPPKFSAEGSRSVQEFLQVEPLFPPEAADCFAI